MGRANKQLASLQQKKSQLVCDKSPVAITEHLGGERQSRGTLLLVLYCRRCSLLCFVCRCTHEFPGTPDTFFSRSHESTELVGSWFTKSACACTYTDESHAALDRCDGHELNQENAKNTTSLQGRELNNLVHEGLKVNVVRHCAMRSTSSFSALPLSTSNLDATVVLTSCDQGDSRGNV